MSAGRRSHPHYSRYLASSGGSSIVGGQASAEIPNEIAIVSRSSLTTMVGFDRVAYCDRLFASVLEEGDTLGALARYRLFLPSSLFDPPPTADEPLPTRPTACCDTPLVQHAWEKNCVCSRSSFNRIWGTALGSSHSLRRRLGSTSTLTDGSSLDTPV